ncbi:MAG: hypothetical protein AAF713_01445 [Pseudomonadota bacterium]
MFLKRREPGPKPILDTGYLDRLETHIGVAKMHELLADGLIELSDRLSHLGTLAARGDRDGIAKLGHDVVATAGHLGLTALSIAAVDMNRAARREPGADPIALVAPVRKLADPSMQALRAHLDLPEQDEDAPD